ncbi:15798_t:CDS:2 [Dentiscutata erythropus]|uniref:15798_t:CDS:1 n=1 Tax=Dentiscutata erythropus TaxID=1348616 RepID=A0A9N9EFY6_9GLOM|nr:15798_t:CDS:2 [Dentiscutata erythropus]
MEILPSETRYLGRKRTIILAAIMVDAFLPLFVLPAIKSF